MGEILPARCRCKIAVCARRVGQYVQTVWGPRVLSIFRETLTENLGFVNVSAIETTTVVDSCRYRVRHAIYLREVVVTLAGCVINLKILSAVHYEHEH